MTNNFFHLLQNHRLKTYIKFDIKANQAAFIRRQDVIAGFFDTAYHHISRHITPAL